MKRKPKQLNFELPLLPSVEDLKANREVEWALPELPEVSNGFYLEGRIKTLQNEILAHVKKRRGRRRREISQ